MTVQLKRGYRVYTLALGRLAALGAALGCAGFGACAVDPAESYEDGKNTADGRRMSRFSEPLPVAAWGHLFRELAQQSDLTAWLALQQRQGLKATGVALSCEMRAPYYAHFSTAVRRTDWDASHRMYCQSESGAPQLRCQIRTDGHCVGTFGGDGRGGDEASRRCRRGASETWAAANAVAPVVAEGGRYWSFRPARSREPRLFLSVTQSGQATLVHESFPVGASARRPERSLLHNVTISTDDPFVQVSQGNRVVAQQAAGVGRCGVNVAFEPAATAPSMQRPTTPPPTTPPPTTQTTRTDRNHQSERSTQPVVPAQP